MFIYTRGHHTRMGAHQSLVDYIWDMDKKKGKSSKIQQIKFMVNVQ